MIFKEGDIVYWVRNTRGIITERAGQVVCVIPSGIHPNNTVFGKICSSKYPARNFITYLVRGNSMIYFVERPEPLTEDKMYILTQQKHTTVKRESPIDRRDRVKIKRMARDMGVDFTETDTVVNVPAWKKRFVFDIEQNEEFVCRIETIKIQ